MKQVYNQFKKFLACIALFLLSASIYGQNAWINEIHYDNYGTDEGEFIEVVVENAGSYTLSDFVVYLYNGNGGGSYNNKGLDVFTVGNTVGDYTFYYYEYPSNGIQNGAPDGMAFAYQGSVISGQFLSYEGTFDATDGPASGMTSVDIGVAEPGEIGESLQLSGNGTGYSDFIWNDPAVETPGALNNNQDFGGPDPEPSNYPTDFNVEATGLSVETDWNDATGAQLPSGYLILGSTSSNIDPPVDGTPVPDDLDFTDGEGAANVAFGVEEYTFYGLESETEYFFEIYPYTNAGTNIDYKTDGTPPSGDDITDYAINTNDFESGDFGTWTTYSVASDKDWEVLDYGGALGTDYFARMNGYQENEASNDWMISPSLNLNEYTDELIFFWTYWRYGDVDSELTLKYSTDYTGGDPTGANWTDLSFSKPDDDQTWENSEHVDLSSIAGDDVHIAFQYLSSGNPRRWDVDEIEITGIAAVPVITVLSPQGGDIWEQGSTHDIEWTVSNTLNTVKIELTTDASSGNPTWEQLVDGIPADQGSWTWDIPADQTTSYDCMIRITDYASDAEGLSEIFWIVEPFSAPAIVITEIMYNPPESGTDSLEFIEIFNNENETVDLDEYYFSDGVEFEFDNVEIEPGEYIVIAGDTNAFVSIFGMSALQWTDGALSNNGELIQLVNPDGNLVDSVNYENIAPWPVAGNGDGPSITFCDPDENNALGENWEASDQFAAVNADGDSIWATPGTGCDDYPNAIFDSDTTIVLVGGQVNYIDLSTGEPTEWLWRFEGGEPATSTLQTPPPVTYNEEGEYAVSLLVTNEFGESLDSINPYVYVGYAPVAAFEASDTAIIVGHTIDFTDLSTGDPYEWAWTFEGGTPETSISQNPENIQYNTMGDYDVTLIVTSMFGVNTLTMEDYIHVGPVGIEDILNTGIVIYPNPSNGEFTLECDKGLYNRLEVYSIIGEKVYHQFISQNRELLNLQSLENGVYFVRLVSDSENTFTTRIIIQ